MKNEKGKGKANEKNIPQRTTNDFISFLSQFEEYANDAIKGKNIVLGMEELVDTNAPRPLSYKELNQKAAQLACVLVKTLGKKQEGDAEEKEIIVGIYQDRLDFMLMCILAVWKAGYAYVPLSTGANIPEERLKAILAECKPDLILTSEKLHYHSLMGEIHFATLPWQSEENKKIDLLWVDEVVNKPFEDVAEAYLKRGEQLTAEKLAYVIYSSGSTGKPKGIEILHRGLFHCMKVHEAYLSITEGDRIAQFGDIGFDASLAEMMMALGTGARLYQVPDAIKLNARALGTFYKNNEITIGIFTPSMLKVLMPEKLGDKLRVIISTGEKLSNDILQKWMPWLNNKNHLFIDGYGPSEVTICTILGKYHPDDEKIGLEKATPGLALFVLPKTLCCEKDELNRTLRLPQAGEAIGDNNVVSEVEEQEEGELYIAAALDKSMQDGIGRGYRGNPLLTKERFGELLIQTPDEGVKRYRVFRTRDLVSWHQKEGKKYYAVHGRLDDYFKWHGVMAHPEEMKAALFKTYSSLLSDVMVVPMGEKNDQVEKVIVFIAFKSEKTLTQAELNGVLKATHQVSLFMKIRDGIDKEKFLNTSNKMDKNKLKALYLDERERERCFEYLSEARSEKTEQINGGEEPRSEDKKYPKLANEIIKIWQDILGLRSSIQIQWESRFCEDFGGNSINFVLMMSKLEKYVGNTPASFEHLTYEKFSKNSSVGFLYRHCQERQRENSTLKRFLVESTYQVPSLFLVHGITGKGSDDFKDFSRAWKKEIENGKILGHLVTFDLIEMAHSEEILQGLSIEEIAENYCTLLKERVDRSQPIILGGYSSGCTIAWEMANQLRHEGKEVNLFLLDGLSPMFFESMQANEHAEYLQTSKLATLLGELYFGQSAKEITLPPNLFEQSKTEQIKTLFTCLREHSEKISKNKDLIHRLAISEAIALACLHYKPKQWVPHATLFVAKSNKQINCEKLPKLLHSTKGWLISPESVKPVLGNHRKMLSANYEKFSEGLYFQLFDWIESRYLDFFTQFLKEEYKKTEICRYLVGKNASIVEHYVEQTFQIVEIPSWRKKKEQPNPLSQSKGLKQHNDVSNDRAGVSLRETKWNSQVSVFSSLLAQLGLSARETPSRFVSVDDLDFEPAMTGGNDRFTRQILLSGSASTSLTSSWGNCEMLFPSLIREKDKRPKQTNRMPMPMRRDPVEHRSSTENHVHEDFPEILAMSDIFVPLKNDTKSGKEVRKVLVCSPSGSGKTTFLENLKYQWAHTQLTEIHRTSSQSGFELLIPISLRTLNDGKLKSRKALFDECFQYHIGVRPKKSMDKDPFYALLFYLLEKKPEKVLFVLDGLNEVNKRSRNYQWIRDILRHEKYYVIATSTMRDDEHTYDLIVALQAFNEMKTRDFIERFFKNDTSAEKSVSLVTEALVQNAQLRQLAALPLQLELICYCYGDLLAANHKNLSLTEIFKMVCDKLWQRFEHKWAIGQEEGGLAANHARRNELKEIRREITRYLRQIAFLVQQNRNFSTLKGMLPQAVTEEAANRIGQGKDANDYLDPITGFTHFLTPHYQGSAKEPQGYYFRHQMFEHFFAAEYIVDSLIYHNKNEEKYSEVKKFIQEIKLYPEYHNTLAFVAGLLKSRKKFDELKAFFDLLLTEPHDLPELSILILIIQCLEECLPLEKGDLSTEEEIKSFIIKRIKIIIDDLNKEDLKYVFSSLKQNHHVSRICLDGCLLLLLNTRQLNRYETEEMSFLMIALATLSMHLTQKENLDISKEIFDFITNRKMTSLNSSGFFAYRQIIPRLNDNSLENFTMYVLDKDEIRRTKKRRLLIDVLGILGETRQDQVEQHSLIVQRLIKYMWKWSQIKLQKKIIHVLKLIMNSDIQVLVACFNDCIAILEKTGEDVFKQNTAVSLLSIILPRMNDKQKICGIELIFAQLVSTHSFCLRKNMIRKIGEMGAVLASVDLVSSACVSLRKIMKPYHSEVIATLGKLGQHAKSAETILKITTILIEFFLEQNPYDSIKKDVALALGEMHLQLTQDPMVYNVVISSLVNLLEEDEQNVATKEAVIIALDQLLQYDPSEYQLRLTIVECLLNLLELTVQAKKLNVAAARTLRTLCTYFYEEIDIENIIERLTRLFNVLPITQHKHIILVLSHIALQKKDKNLAEKLSDRIIENLNRSQDEKAPLLCVTYLGTISLVFIHNSDLVKKIGIRLSSMLEGEVDEELVFVLYIALEKIRPCYAENEKHLSNVISISKQLLRDKTFSTKVQIAIIKLIGELAPLAVTRQQLFDGVIPQLIVLLKQEAGEELKKTIVQALKQFSFAKLVKQACSDEDFEYRDVLREKLGSEEKVFYLTKEENKLYLEYGYNKILIASQNVVLVCVLLHKACAWGHLSDVKLLLEIAPSVIHLHDKYGRTPLHAACQEGHLKVAQFLVEHGANVNAADKNGWTPLHVVCVDRYLEMTQFLVEHGAEVNAVTKEGWTALRSACISGDLEAAEFLVRHGAEVNAVTKEGWTPLHSACIQGHLKVAQFLVERGADVDAASKEGWTPLHMVCSDEYYLEVAKFLVKHGADVDASDKEGWTPFHSACINGHLEMVNFFIKQDVDIADNEGRTPLRLACQNGHVKVAEFLVSRGADVNAADKDGYTPLHSVCLNGRLEVAQFLVSRGTDVKATENEGLTSLHLACLSGHLQMVEFLVEQELDVNVVSQEEWTPLHLACQNGHLEVVQFLVEKGADVDVTHERGWTPLHFACHNGYLQVVEFLVEQKVDVHVMCKDGWTPLHLAYQNGHEALAQFLVEQGAEVDTEKMSLVEVMDKASEVLGRGQHKYAVNLYQRAAERGHALAQYYLGVIYANGRVIKKDELKAFEWFEKAANQENPDAQYMLGEIYKRKEDYKNASMWLEKAADQENSDAQYIPDARYNLGLMYAKGQSVEKNEEKAFKWFKRAAKQGHRYAQYAVGRRYLFGIGTKKDEEKALEFFEKGAKQGEIYSQRSLGLMYYGIPFVKVVKKDDTKSFEWLQKAAEQEDACSQYYLGKMYLHYLRNRVLSSEECTKAFKWFREAAEQGYARAQYEQGLMFKDGCIVEKDYIKAFEWFQKAAKQGNLDARCELGQMYHGKKDDAKAFEWYKNLACCYHTRALSNTSSCDEAIELADGYFVKALEIKREAKILCEYSNFLMARANRLAISEFELASNWRQEVVKYLLEAKDLQNHSGLRYTMLEYNTVDIGLQRCLDKYGKIESLNSLYYAHYLLIVNYLKLNQPDKANEIYAEFEKNILENPETEEIVTFLKHEIDLAIQLSLESSEDIQEDPAVDNKSGSPSIALNRYRLHFTPTQASANDNIEDRENADFLDQASTFTSIGTDLTKP